MTEAPWELGYAAANLELLIKERPVLESMDLRLGSSSARWRRAPLDHPAGPGRTCRLDPDGQAVRRARRRRGTRDPRDPRDRESHRLAVRSARGTASSRSPA